MVKKRVEKGKSTKEHETDTFPKGYDPEQVRSGVKALFTAVEKDESKKKSLFSGEGDFVLIQVSCVRIPKLTRKNYRFPLPHGFLKDTSEVCLFVRNLQGNKDLEYEETVRHYKNLLSEAGVTSVHEVISVNQLKQEYKTYEMKRRLAARFDFFLGDAVVNDWLNGLVGKNFHRCKKIPNPVKLDSSDLKAEIDRALHKTTMVVTGHGDNFGVKLKKGEEQKSSQEEWNDLKKGIITMLEQEVGTINKKEARKSWINHDMLGKMEGS
ncbi:hypothetical protein J437_LFUL000243 [Ladona fulva]|uniref:Ribosomal L1 domain-containing protein 1 n=1 Tax=Ladona fulva TaxID=123851 RepID=A0A8K0NV31_LADFU|nr:hypothetical protein J437_LFUL000243 [Ladona fulva]